MDAFLLREVCRKDDLVDVAVCIIPEDAFRIFT